ncbi:MAG TPA: MXAN_5187 C-terminal domain-containing protein [Polyangiaceae bacterium]|nr:MXAN_5187 C-terminal domain-containing protein [Polyangiaceae bacterium]
MEAAELAEQIEELENRVERLRAMYEQYFMGIERIEPLIARKDIDRRLWILRREQIRNTGMRFKLQTTVQRYNTYQQYWQRITREIENGTYQRDLGRAAKRFGENVVTALGRRRQKMFEKGLALKAERDAAREARNSAPPPAQEEASSETFEVSFEDEPESTGPSTPKQGSMPELPPRPPVQPKTVPQPPLASVPLRKLPGQGAPRAGLPGAGLPPLRAPLPSRPELPQAAATGPVKPPLVAAKAVPTALAKPAPAPVAVKPALAAAPSAADGELSAARMRQIYGQFVDAKRRANESTAALTYDKIAANLKDTEKALREKHKGRNIDFEVTMKNGKPVLKPVLKG